MLKIRKGDDVVILAGKDKGKQGSVLRLVIHDKLIVEGINMVKKHEKPQPATGTPGGIVEKEMPIHASNVAIYNPETKKADRVGFRALDDGKQVRYFKSTNEVVDI